MAAVDLASVRAVWLSAVDRPHQPERPSILEAKVPAISLSERERELVALLSQGHSDQEAAERLGISPRTVTNLVRGLMDRLGVDNRFQLGLALGSLRKGHGRENAEVGPGDVRP